MGRGGVFSKFPIHLFGVLQLFPDVIEDDREAQQNGRSHKRLQQSEEWFLQDGEKPEEEENETTDRQNEVSHRQQAIPG